MPNIKRKPSLPNAEQQAFLTVGELHLLIGDSLRAVFTSACRTEGLTFGQGRALRLLAKNAPQHRLIDLVSDDPSRVSAILRRLEDQELITRSRSRGDRRQRDVTVTERGTATVNRINSRLAEDSVYLVALDEEERRTIRRLLEKMVDGI